MFSVAPGTEVSAQTKLTRMVLVRRFQFHAFRNVIHSRLASCNSLSSWQVDRSEVSVGMHEGSS